MSIPTNYSEPSQNQIEAALPDWDKNSVITTTTTKKSYAGRAIAVAKAVGTSLSVAALHVGTNIFLGTGKGLEVSAATPVVFLHRQANKLTLRKSCLRGTLGTIVDKTYIGAGIFVGAIVGTVAAVPGLLIGMTYGLCRGLLTLPTAIKNIPDPKYKIDTAWNNTQEAAKRHYNINLRKIRVIATVSTLPLAIGLTVVAGVAVGPALAGIVGYLAALGVLTSVNFTGQYFYPDDSQKYDAKKLEQKEIEQKKIIEQKRITEENKKIKQFSIQEPSK